MLLEWFGFFVKKDSKHIRDEEILKTSAWQVWTVAKNKANGEQNGCVYCGEEELV